MVHQPRYSVFQLFDDALFLGKGGKTVFLGPSHLALPYFESLNFRLPPNENPADFVMVGCSGGGAWAQQLTQLSAWSTS